MQGLRRLLPALTVLTLTAALGGCSALPGRTTGYRMSAYFAKAPSLYKQSRVKVLGAEVGTITAITIERARVRVDFTIDRDVPVPAGVHASIEAADTLGDRSVVLTPPWKPGMAKAPPGTVIPQDRTRLPVEIDEALAAFTKLNSAIDPKRLGALAHSGALALDGKGQSINTGLQAAAMLTHDLAAQDDKLVRIADGLHSLAAGLNDDHDLGATVDSVATASGMLADERARLQSFLSGLAAVIRKSGVLITAYQETLPSAAADLSNIVMTLKAGSGSINQLITSLSKFADITVNAWDRENHVAVIRVQINATVRAWLQPLFDAMGWGRVPCIPDNTNLANCPAKGTPR